MVSSAVSGSVNNLSSATELKSISLDSAPVGVYSHESVQADFGPIQNWSNGFKDGRVTIVDINNSKRLRVAYPVGYGTRNTGAQFKALLPAQEQLCVSFKLDIPAGFEFGRGGKLFGGLAGGSANTGSKSNAPNGKDGWSSRIMWREDGQLRQYSYLWMDETGRQSVAQHYSPWKINGKPVLLTAGEHQLEICASMNTVVDGKAVRDGKIQAWYDGTSVLDSSVGFRTTTDLKADIFYFSTFIGGNNDSWSTDTDRTIDYWDIKLSTQPLTASD